VTVDRLNELLSPDNVGAVSDTLRNLSTTTTGIAKQDAAIQAMLAELPGAVAEFRKTFDKLNGVADSLNMIALEIGPQDEATRKALAGKTRANCAKRSPRRGRRSPTSTARQASSASWWPTTRARFASSPRPGSPNCRSPSASCASSPPT